MPDNYYIEQLIIRYLQKSIRDDELAELENWIQADPANRSVFFETKNIHDLCKKTRSVFAQDEVWERMYARLNKKTDSGKWYTRVFINSKTTLKYAAILIGSLYIGWTLGRIPIKNSKLQEKEISPVMNEVLVNKGGIPNTITLSDGSTVILNAASHIKYPSEFDHSKREIYLEGEAYFDIKENKEKPFIVHLDHQTITVLGTTFNIEAFEKEEYSKTTLFTGSLFIETFNEEGEKINSFRISPNQQLISNNINGSVNISRVDTSLSKAWLNREYKFKDEPLSSIVKRLKNYYGIEIIIEDESIKDYCYTGTFSLDQSIPDVLKIINNNNLFTYKKEENIYYINKNK